jgi:PLD-like domain
MEQKLEDNEQVSLKELVVANSIQVDVLTQLLIDKRTVIMGSFNFTKAAEEKNAENLLIVKSKELAEVYIENCQRHREHSEAYAVRY